ncbi:hypothetical protein PybrP1_005770 [[Pythium] brassicae (nom. inval.)]|nr:hypothetical protein PybrP1_005770 [[Pythium] brassicae (nom. inval.)]
MTEEASSADVAEAADGFFRAAEHGRADVLKALADHARGRLSLARVVDPATGRSPLHVAVARANADAVRVLLAAGFPADHASLPPTALTPYQLAQQQRAPEIVAVFHQFAIQQVAADDARAVRRLLRAGVRPDATDGAARNSLLHWAVTCAAAQTLELLLQHEQQPPAAVNSTNADGATPLHLACRVNNAACARLLLRHGADATVKGDAGAFIGRTALELATTQEVTDAFAAAEIDRRAQLADTSPSAAPLPSSSSSSSSSSIGSSPVSSRSTGDSDAAGAAAAGPSSQTRRPSHADRELPNARLLLQLEEKELLVIQLRKTIETLENAVLQRNLEDAEEHIRIQHDQLQQLKHEMRRMVTQGDEALENDDASDQQLPASPLRLTPSDVRRDEPPPSSHSSESWNRSFLGGLWPFGVSDDAEDVDGEVIMTV